MTKERENIINEYLNITNDQAYYNSFNKRVLKSLNNKIIGNTQRDDFLPYLKDLLRIEKKINIFDLGCGSGEILDYIKEDLKNKDVTFNLEEPNNILLKLYKDKLSNMNFNINKTYNTPIQDLYLKNDLPKNNNLILSIHMIYHLTNFVEKDINPEKDIIDFVDFLFNCLSYDGVIFLVYADLENSYVGEVTLDYYKNNYNENEEYYYSNIKKIYRARNYMFKENNIEKILKNKYDNFITEVYNLESFFYGDTLEDIATMSLVSELIPSNKDIFEIKKLNYVLNLVYEKKINIDKENKNILQKNMFKVNQNQILYIIKKNIHKYDQYDNIYEKYKISKQLPFREYIEKNSLLSLIKDVKNLKVLDLACGEGHYTRIIRNLGAKEVVGIDISENMINMAKSENEINNIKNIKYYNCNVIDMNLLDIELEYFDIIVAAYLLNYAKSKEELFNFTKIIFKYLKPGCKFISINDNPSVCCNDNCSLKYHYLKKHKKNDIPKNGDCIEWSFYNSKNINDQLCKFDIYHWDKNLYIESLKNAGFDEINFVSCDVSKEGVNKYGKIYWDNFLRHPHLICIQAIKPIK